MGLHAVQLGGQGAGGSWGAAAWTGPGSCQQARQLPAVCLPQFPHLHSGDPPRVSVRTGESQLVLWGQKSCTGLSKTCSLMVKRGQADLSNERVSGAEWRYFSEENQDDHHVCRAFKSGVYSVRGRPDSHGVGAPLPRMLTPPCRGRGSPGWSPAGSGRRRCGPCPPAGGRPPGPGSAARSSRSRTWRKASRAWPAAPRRGLEGGQLAQGLTHPVLPGGTEPGHRGAAGGNTSPAPQDSWPGGQRRGEGGSLAHPGDAEQD